MKLNQFTTKPLQVFRDPEDEGGMSPAAQILADDLPDNDDEPTDTEEAESETPEAAPSVGAFDPAALAAALKGAIEPLVQARNEPKQEPKQLTPEEARKLLNFFEPDDDLVSKFHNVDTTKEALALLRDGFTKQNVTIMRALADELRAELRGEYSPLISAQAAREAQERETRFTGAYPELADPKLKPIIEAVGNQFVQSKTTFKTESELFTALAKGVEAVAKQFNPAFKLTGGATAAVKNKTGNPNSLPSAKPGAGKGGGAAPGGDGKPKNLALSILTGKS